MCVVILTCVVLRVCVCVSPHSRTEGRMCNAVPKIIFAVKNRRWTRRECVPLKRECWSLGFFLRMALRGFALLRTR